VSDGFESPLFGLATAPDGSLLVADAGAGIVELRRGDTLLVAELPGVTDVAPIGRGTMWAVTGEPPEDPSMSPLARKLFRVSRGSIQLVADLGAFEMTHNPDGTDVNSNPFDVVALGGRAALVADAGANDLLIVDNQGRIDWVATFPLEPVSTSNVKQLVGCPDAPEDLEFVCELPDAIPAQPVSASLAVGPDGAYYVGELKGFPAPTGASRVWRIEPGARHVRCGIDPECSVVLEGLTSIIDLTFDNDGTLYVLELDEASWLAAELGLGSGGVLNACDVATGACGTLASGLPLPTAATIGDDGSVYHTILALVPGEAAVVRLPGGAPGTRPTRWAKRR